MLIDETYIINDDYCDESSALACLLAKDVCFLNNADISYTYKKNYDIPKYTTCIYVNCGDTFHYACADAECVTSSDGDEDSEIIKLYKYCSENWKFGSTKFCALKRNMKPLPQIVEMMKNDNFWDDELENLPENGCKIFKH